MSEVAERLEEIVLLVGLDGRILDANNVALSAYGYTAEEMKSLTIFDLRTEEFHEAVGRQMSEAAQHSLHFETEHRRKDGTTFPVDVHSGGVTVGGVVALLSIVRDVSGTRRAKQAEQEREILARTERSAHIGSWMVSYADGTAMQTDEAFRIYGVDRATSAGDFWEMARTMVHPEDRAEFDAALLRMREGSSTTDAGYRIVRADGEIRWIESHVEVLTSATGVPMGVTGFIHDVTELKIAQTAAAERAAAVRSLLDAITESAFVITPDGVIVAMNETTARRLGFEEAEELVGKSIYALVAPDLAASRRSQVARVLETGLPVQFEDVHDGRVVLSSLSPVFVDGRVAEIAVFGYDLTDVRETDAALRMSERALREAQRIARIGHYVLDLSTGRLENPATMYDVFDVGAAHLRGLDEWLEIMHHDDRAGFMTHLSAARKNGTAIDIEYRIVRPSDGHVFWAHEVGEALRDEAGVPVKIFGTLQDITQRKESELAILAEHSRLEQVEAIGHIGSWRIDLETGGGQWSDEYVRLLGFDPGAAEGDPLQSFIDYVHPEDRAAFIVEDPVDPWRSGVASIDFRVVRPGGEVRWLTTTGTLERDGAGKPVAVVGVLQDITDRKRAENVRTEHLEQEANLDRLTGLYNRRGFDLLADKAVEQIRRAGIGLGVIYCDVDNLKQINDEFGHPQGDRALRDLSSVLKHVLRGADVIARVGGDEFLVLSGVTSEQSLERLVDRFDGAVELFNATNERPYLLSASCGAAWGGTSEEWDLDELTSTADLHMYAAKQRKRINH